MIKGLMIRRIFNAIVILLLLAIVSGSAYFYVSERSNVKTIDASLALLNDITSQKNIVSGLGEAVSNLSNLAMMQVMTFFALSVSLLFLLWFVFRLYSVEKLNALIDPLTEIYNRRAIMLGLKNELERAERFNHHLTIAVLDVDYFKQYNDTYGHKAGDRALIRVAKIIDRTIRKTDMVGRIGGEEFLIIFPETTYAKAVRACERIRVNVQKSKFEFEEGISSKELTVSIGLAEFKENHIKNETDIFESADKQLYLAKLSGRNSIK